jgi:hypothetical protein
MERGAKPLSIFSAVDVEKHAGAAGFVGPQWGAGIKIFGEEPVMKATRWV